MISDSPPLNPKKRRKHRAIWVILGGISLIFMVLALPPVQRVLAQYTWNQVVKVTGLRVEVERVDWKWPVGLILHHAVLQDSQGNPVVHLRKLTVSGVSFAPGGGLSLAGIRVDGGQVLLQKLPRDSTWTLSEALAPLLNGPPAENPLAWKIHGLQIDDLRVFVHNAQAPSWPKEAVIQGLRVRELKSDATGKISLVLEQFRATDANENRFLALSAGLEIGADGEWTLEEGRLNATGLTLKAEANGRGADTVAVKFEARGEVSELLAWPRWFGISTDTLPQAGTLELAGNLERLRNSWRWNQVKASIPGVELTSSGEGNEKNKTFELAKTTVRVNGPELLKFWPDATWNALRTAFPPQLRSTVRLSGKADQRKGWAMVLAEGTQGESVRLDGKWQGSLRHWEDIAYHGIWAVSVPAGSHWMPDSLDAGPLLVKGELQGTSLRPEKWTGTARVDVLVARVMGWKADGWMADVAYTPHAVEASWTWFQAAVRAQGSHRWDLDNQGHQGEWNIERLSLRDLGLADALEGSFSSQGSYTYQATNGQNYASFNQSRGQWQSSTGKYPLGALAVEADWNTRTFQAELRADALDATFQWTGGLVSLSSYMQGNWEARLSGHPASWGSQEGSGGTAELAVKEASNWLHALDTSLYLASGSRIQWGYSGSNRSMSLDLRSPWMRFQGNRLFGLRTQIEHRGNTAYGEIQLDSAAGLFAHGNLHWRAEQGAGSLDWELHGPKGSELGGRGTVLAQYLAPSRWNGEWVTGELSLPTDTLRLESGAPWTWSGESLALDRLLWKGKKGSLALDGILSKDPQASFRVQVNQVPLSVFRPWLSASKTDLQGALQGELVVQSPLGTPGLQGTLAVDSLIWNREWMGRLKAQASFSPNTRLSALSLTLDRGERRTLSARGTYDPEDSQWPIQATVHLDRFRLMALQPYLAGTLDRFRGTLRGEVKLQMNASKHSLTGELEFPSFAASIPLLGTDYGVDGVPRLTLADHLWTLHPIGVRDTKERTQGLLQATFRPNQFKDPRLDLKLQATDLLALDLPTSDLFFGKVYAKGEVRVFGPLDDLKLDVRAEAAKPSVFKLPLSSPTEYEENGSISFVQPVHLGNSNAQKTKVVRGLDVSLALQVTPLITMEMLLDETVGDIIRGRGEGTVRVDYPPTGDLRLNGTVTLTSGDYLFTLQNLINKSFEVEPGGTLSWTGDPYAGTVNMRALYTTRTALTGMVNQPDYAGQRVPVQLGLGLSGPLMQPQLAFDFALPNANPAWQEELRNRLADADKRNIQAFSLLLTNGFWQSSEGVLSHGVQSVNSNTTQMLASQFSNFLSQGLGDLISIDLAYSGSDRSDARDQLEVALSKAFLNDRINVQTTLDVPMGRQGASNSTSGLVGDVQVNYKITQDGRWKARAFNRSNTNNPALDRLSPYTQGVGIEFGTQAQTWSGLFKRRRKDR